MYVIVQCFQCETYMANMQTKANKWCCRMCGAKQSIVRVFGRSEQAKDLRATVQALNAHRGDQAPRDPGGPSGRSVSVASPGSGRSEETVSSSDASAGQSRWDAYVTTEHVSHQFVQSNAEEEKFVTEIPGATKRRRGVTERRPAVEQRDEQQQKRTRCGDSEFQQRKPARPEDSQQQERPTRAVPPPRALPLRPKQQPQQQQQPQHVERSRWSAWL